jgi:hypothetical protein
MEQGRQERKAGGMRRWRRGFPYSRNGRRVTKASPIAVIVFSLSTFLLPLKAYCDEATLTLDVVTLSFPSSDPDAVPQMSAIENPVSVSVKVRASNPAIVDLTVISAGDLMSGSDFIAIDRVSWTASGDGFVPGALSKTDPQPVGQWFDRRVDVNGTLWFQLENSWDYATGTYSQTAIYTLVAY